MKNEVFLTALVVSTVFLASGCGDSSELSAVSGQFTAEMSGSIDGHVSGPGVINYIPPSNSAVGVRPGYFFIADNTGVRDLGITFTIPSDTKAGAYELVSAHPFDAGKKFEVRIDRSVGNRTESFQLNTAGTITLERFPEDGSNLAEVHVKGNFVFTTEGKDEQRVTAEGVFDFQGK